MPGLPRLEPIDLVSAPDLDAVVCDELRRRLELLDALEQDETDAALVRELARRDVVFWANSFAVTYDPRKNLTMPFVLWPRQVEYLRFLEQSVAGGSDLVCEKSRDVGVSYLNALFAVHRWLYVPGFKSTFCANKFDQVDRRGDPDSIFEKIRIVVRGLPKWMLPKGFSLGRHDPEGRLINPENRNIISGEGGENAGRGGRSTIYFIDEAAFIRNAQAVNAATSANAECRAWCSSANGTGNFFAELAQSGNTPVFRFHWRDDPRKDEEWAAERKRRVGEVTFASEYDIDYGASIEGLVIQNVWIEAAVELRRRLAEQVTTVRARCGLDVGGGRAESALITRKGPLVLEPEVRLQADTIEVAHWALERAHAASALFLAYDNVGVGQGVAATLNRAELSGLAVFGVNTGLPATKAIWPDGRRSSEFLDNLKADLWWKAREAFRRSYELLRFLDGYDDGIDHPLETVILMCDDLVLRRQLNTPKYFKSEAGLIFIERKAQLAARGVKSPDRADAFVLTFHEPDTAFFVSTL